MKKTKKIKTLGLCHKPETMGKHYKGRSKKHLSKAQEKALAKGRKVLSYLRTGRKIAEPKEPLLITEGIMEGKKRAKKHAKKLHGTSKKAYKVTHQIERLHGAKDGFNPGNMALDIAGLLTGAIGVSFLASLIPIKNAKIKPLLPLALGIIGLSMPKISKNRFANRAALGSLSIGGYALTKTFLPTMPLMGAADTAEGVGNAIANLPPEEKALLGILPDQLEYQGDPDSDATATTAGTEYIQGDDLEGAPGEMLGETNYLTGDPGEMLGDTEFIGESVSDFS